MTWQYIPLRAATLLDRSPERVRHALTRVDVWHRAAAAVGYRLAITPAGADAWHGGEVVAINRIGRRPRHRAVVDLDSAGLPTATIIGGVAAGGRVRVALDATGAGALVTVEFAAPDRDRGLAAAVARLLQSRHRKRVLVALRTLLGIVTLEQHQTQIVVAGAIIRGGRVLAARRTHPAALAGRWEFPGGKLAVGESDEDGLRRELTEELGVAATIGQRVGPEVSLDLELALRLYAVTLQPDSAAAVQPREHDQVRWLTASDLTGVDWLDADRALLPAVRALLGGPLSASLDSSTSAAN